MEIRILQRGLKREINEYLAKIDRSIEQFSQGHTVVKTIEEFEDMAK